MDAVGCGGTDVGHGGTDVLGCIGMCRDVSGRVGMCWDVLGRVGMCQDVLGCVGVYWDVSGCVGMWLSCAPVPRRAAVRPRAAVLGLRVLLPRQLRGRGRCRGGALPGRLRQRLRVRPGAVPGRGGLRPPERLPLPPRPPAVRPGAEHPPALQPVVSAGGGPGGGKKQCVGGTRRPRHRPCPRSTCRGGRWLCTQDRCAAECAVLGGLHYVTFDQRRFSFPGACEYILVQVRTEGVWGGGAR